MQTQLQVLPMHCETGNFPIWTQVNAHDWSHWSSSHVPTHIPPVHVWFPLQSACVQHWVAHAHALPTLL